MKVQPNRRPGSFVTQLPPHQNLRAEWRSPAQHQNKEATPEQTFLKNTDFARTETGSTIFRKLLNFSARSCRCLRPLRWLQSLQSQPGPRASLLDGMGSPNCHRWAVRILTSTTPCPITLLSHFPALMIQMLTHSAGERGTNAAGNPTPPRERTGARTWSQRWP